MLLRRSGDLNDESYDLSAITGEGGRVGVEHEATLVAIAEAVFHGNPEKLGIVRQEAVDVLGEQSLVDAIAVASGFNGITKIANGTGLPLDQRTAEITTQMRQVTGINDFADTHKSSIYT